MNEVKRYKQRDSMPDTAALFLPNEVVSAAEAERERLANELRRLLIVESMHEKHRIRARPAAIKGQGE